MDTALDVVMAFAGVVTAAVVYGIHYLTRKNAEREALLVDYQKRRLEEQAKANAAENEQISFFEASLGRTQTAPSAKESYPITTVSPHAGQKP